MFSEDFIKDFETYGKDSEMCRIAYEQLRKVMEQEKARKQVEDVRKQRVELIKKIEEVESELSAIAYIIERDGANLDEATIKGLQDLATKLEVDRDIAKTKITKLREQQKKEQQERCDKQQQKQQKDKCEKCKQQKQIDPPTLADILFGIL